MISLTLERIIGRVSGEAMSAVCQHLISTSPSNNKNPSGLHGWKMASGVSYRAQNTFLIRFYTSIQFFFCNVKNYIRRM